MKKVLFSLLTTSCLTFTHGAASIAAVEASVECIASSATTETAHTTPSYLTLLGAEATLSGSAQSQLNLLATALYKPNDRSVDFSLPDAATTHLLGMKAVVTEAPAIMQNEITRSLFQKLMDHHILTRSSIVVSTEIIKDTGAVSPELMSLVANALLKKVKNDTPIRLVSRSSELTEMAITVEDLLTSITWSLEAVGKKLADLPTADQEKVALALNTLLDQVKSKADLYLEGSYRLCAMEQVTNAQNIISPYLSADRHK